MIFRRRKENNTTRGEYPVIYAETWPPIIGVNHGLPTPIIVFGTRRASTDLEIRVEKHHDMTTHLVAYVSNNEMIAMEIGCCNSIYEAANEMKKFESFLNAQTNYRDAFADGVCNPMRTIDNRIHTFLSDMCWISKYGRE